MKKIILYSGGADSRLMLHRALGLFDREDIVLLHVDYGQKMPELEACVKIAPKERVMLRVVKTVMPPNPLTGDAPKNTSPNVSDAWVPGRNAVLLAIAAAWSEHYKADEIWVGFDKDDQALFPDCSRNFANNMMRAMNLARDPALCPLKITTPLLWTSKDDVIEALCSHEIPPDEYVSGYPNTEVEGA